MNCAKTMKPLRTSPRDAALLRPAPTAAAAPDTDRCRASTASARRRRAGPPRSCTAFVKSSDVSSNTKRPVSRADAHHFRPAAVDAVEQRDRDRAGAGDVDEHLDDVGPDHRRRRRRAWCRRSSRRRGRSPPTSPAPASRSRSPARSVNRRMPSASERVIRKITADSVFTRRAEPALQQLVRREQIAAEVRRDEQHADEDRGR